jgi:subtilisin-like proprotein convertase family protein
LGLLLLMIGVMCAHAFGARRTHKLRVSDPAAAARLVAAGGRLVADYGSFQILEIPATAPGLAAPMSGAGVEQRDDFDTILLNAGPIDTAAAPAGTAAAPLAAFEGKRLHLVHFAGPVKPEWVEALRKTGVEIVTYLPNNAYLIYGEAAAIGRARAPAAGSALAAFQDWEGAYLDAYKIDPAARTTDAAGHARAIGTAYFVVQMVADEQANPATVAVIEGLALGKLLRSERSLNYYNVIAPLPAERVADIAARPEVISIQPYFVPQKLDERQDQIIAGNLTGSVPSNAGYLAWLSGAGFTQNQFTLSGFAVDVTDSGLDNGTTFPNHFGLYQSGARPGTSRVVYNRLEGTPHSGTSLSGVDGHGTLNGHIIGGYNNLTGSPHQDASGFRFGLGVAPFVRLGSSVIFDPNSFTSPTFKDLQARAYRDGVRISSNSWGANTAGAYNTDAQSYDALVRDAQPSDAAVPTAGNQGMVIVFANGNAGSGAQTVGSPGTAKNVISVGAAENVQAFGGTDGSGVGDTGADSANDIISFSSRGPCSDGRKKPDLVAPGTHVSGGVWQTANPGPNGTADPFFAGSGVSGGTGGSHFFPGNGSTQQFYTASSGTSHSTPCVAGGAALVRQYFLNRNFAAPSAAMTKAFLMNSSRYLTGVSANDALPSNNQGMGEMNLGMAFDGVARLVRDQLAADKFTATGQARVFNLNVVNTAKPLRVTVAWTDAPGSTTGNAYKNDLDLTVTAGGNTYLGNVFTGASSTTGGAADVKNNVESVFLPAGVSGAVTVTVTASNINSDGVPNDSDLLDQDFALVAYDALPAGTASVLPNGATVTAESLAPANGVIDNNETVTVSFNLQNAGNTALGNLVATLQNSGGVTGGSGPQSYGTLAAGASVARPFTFTASGTPGGPLTATLSLADGATNLGTVTFGFSLPRPPLLIAGTSAITAENLFTNNLIDTGETVTVNFQLINIGDAATSSLVATLRNSGGVNSASGPQNFGAVAVGTPAARAFTFTASGAPGNPLTATFDLNDGATNLGTVAFSFVLANAPTPAANGATITAESSAPANGAIDPGEVVTVNFALRNAGDEPLSNLVATLQASGGVASPSGPQNYGAIAAGASVARAFTFTGTGARGSTLTATFQLQDGAVNYGTVAFTFVIGRVTFANTASITINDNTTGTPYPSTIAVSGISLTGGAFVSKVTARLVGLTHTFPGDTEMLLVGPTGQKMLLLRQVGGGFGVSNINLTLDDAAAAALPTTSALTTGTFRPTTNGTATSFQNPAPAIPYGAALSVFNNQDPNGTWSLYVRDVFAQDLGSIAQGWEVAITTTAPAPANVTGVSSTAANGAYPAGTTIPITVTFSSAVTVTGTPRLQLNSGAAAFANYASGSGTSTLTFNHVVSPGDASSLLDYISSSALTLNGGAIVNSGANSLLTLPAPGAPGSLGANTILVIDTQAPTVAITPASASTNSSPIVFTLTFSEPVSLTAAGITVTNGTKGTLTNVGSIYSLPVTPSAQGAVTCRLGSGAAQDLAGNGNVASNTASVVFDTVAPLLTAVTVASNNALPSRAKVENLVTVSLTSNEPIDTPAVTIANRAALVTGSGTNWSATVLMQSTDAEGIVPFSIGFNDLTGNAGAGVTATTNLSTVTLDRTPPTLLPVTIASNHSNPAFARLGETITLSFSASEALQPPVVTIAGQTATVNLVSGNAWTATTAVSAGAVQGPAAFSVAFSDLAGNAGVTISNTTNGSTVTIDSATITPLLSAPANGLLTKSPVAVAFHLPEAAKAASVKLIFSSALGSKELILASTEETLGDHGFSFNPAAFAGTAAIASGVPIPDDTYTVTLSYQDALGNVAAGAAASAVTIDTTPPALALVDRSVIADQLGFATVPNFSSMATDAHGVATFHQSPTAGTSLGLGSHPVTISAIDTAGNPASGELQLKIAFQRPVPPATVTASAHSGMAAPGAGLRGGPPAGTTLSTFGVPAVSDFRDLAARVTMTAGRTKLAGIYLEDAAGVGSLPAFQGMDAPGFGPGVTFESFVDPVIAQGGAIAFAGKTRGGGVKRSGDAGVWTTAFGNTLELVLREGEDVPGLDPGARLKSVTSLSLRDGGLVALVKLKTEKGIVAARQDDVVLLRVTGPNSANVLLRSGAPFSKTTIEKLSVLQPALGSPAHGRWHANSALVAKVTLADGSVDLLRIAPDGTATSLLGTGTPWSGFGLPAVGSTGANYAVLGELAPAAGVESGTNAALAFSTDGLAFGIFTREGDQAPMAPAPTGPTYHEFFDPVVNDAGDVAFLATLEGEDVNAANKTGLWWGTPAAPELLARLGNIPPGRDGLPLAGAVWSKFISYALPGGPHAGPIFLAELDGPAVNSKSKLGVWAVDSTGAPRLLLRTGDPVEVDGQTQILEEMQLLNALEGSFGAARSYNETGSVAVLATFARKSQALLRIDLP